VVSMGLNFVTGLIARRHAKKAKLLPLVIRGVETAPDNEAVKRSIKAEALAAGMEPILNKEVKQHSRLVAFRRP